VILIKKCGIRCFCLVLQNLCLQFYITTLWHFRILAIFPGKDPKSVQFYSVHNIQIDFNPMSLSQKFRIYWPKNLEFQIFVLFRLSDLFAGFKFYCAGKFLEKNHNSKRKIIRILASLMNVLLNLLGFSNRKKRKKENWLRLKLFMKFLENSIDRRNCPCFLNQTEKSQDFPSLHLDKLFFQFNNFQSDNKNK
jgi:hypothetical protein